MKNLRILTFIVGLLIVAQLQAAPPRGESIDSSPVGIAPEPPPAVAPSHQNAGPCPRIGFDLLADYDFTVPDNPLTNQPAMEVAKLNKTIPAKIIALNDHQVIVTGFMVPLDMTDGRSTNFLVVRDPPGCCYSMPARINEFVSIKLAGKGIRMNMDGPVNIAGTLHVGVRRDIDGYVTGLYQLDGEKEVEDAK